MAGYIAQRLILLVLQALGVATFVFLLLHLVPGDPARAMLGETATAEQIAAVRQKLGLDRPLPEQYLDWLLRLARGDLGTSLISGRSVAGDLLDRLPRTLELVLSSTALGLLLAVPLGTLAAIRRNRPADVAVSTLALVGLSLPGFVVGTILLLIFVLNLGLVPAMRFVSFEQNPGEHLRLIILPVVTLALSNSAVLMRMMRSSMLEVIGQDYVRTARAKGLANATVLLRHALKNALNPVLTLTGLEIGTLLGGTVIVEYIFGWPGLSTLLLSGVRERDYPVVQGTVLLISVLFISINLIVDLLYGWLDPRIRYA